MYALNSFEYVVEIALLGVNYGYSAIAFAN